MILEIAVATATKKQSKSGQVAFSTYSIILPPFSSIIVSYAPSRENISIEYRLTDAFYREWKQIQEIKTEDIHEIHSAY